MMTAEKPCTTTPLKPCTHQLFFHVLQRLFTLLLPPLPAHHRLHGLKLYAPDGDKQGGERQSWRGISPRVSVNQDGTAGWSPRRDQRGRESAFAPSVHLSPAECFELVAVQRAVDTAVLTGTAHVVHLMRILDRKSGRTCSEEKHEGEEIPPHIFEFFRAPTAFARPPFQRLTPSKSRDGLLFF